MTRPKTPARSRPHKRPWWLAMWLWTKYKILRLRGTPQSIAKGFAIGGAVSFAPLLGIHIAMACSLAYATRSNLIAATLGTFVSNPFTIPLMFWADYKIGTLIFKLTGNSLHTQQHNIDFTNIPKLLETALDIYLPMWVGGVALMLISYPLFYHVCLPLAARIKQYQVKRRKTHTPESKTI